MEKDGGFPQNGKTACQRNTSVSLHKQKGAVWQDNQDTQPDILLKLQLWMLITQGSPAEILTCKRLSCENTGL